MPLTILKYALFLMVDIAIIGCVFHFFYTGLRKPVDFVELGKTAKLSWEGFTYGVHRTIPGARWFRLGTVLYLLAVFLGVGVCIYGGMSKLLSWMPYSSASDGIWEPNYIAGFVGFTGAGGLIALMSQSAHDFEAAIKELAMKSGNVEYFRRYLLDASSPNRKYAPYGETLLYQLAALGNETLPAHARMAEELLSSPGADVNCRTILGWTPLHFIAIQGQPEAAELAKVLIAHGLDLAAIDNQGRGWKDYWQQGKEIYTVLNAAESLDRGSSQDA